MVPIVSNYSSNEVVRQARSRLSLGLVGSYSIRIFSRILLRRVTTIVAAYYIQEVQIWKNNWYDAASYTIVGCLSQKPEL